MAAPRNDNVKEKILQATELLTTQHEFSDITLAKIATTAQISKGTLYYHYNSKDEILLDVTTKFLDDQMAGLIRWSEDKSKDISLHRILKFVIKGALTSSKTRMYLTFNAIQNNEEIRARLLERYDIFCKNIAKAISKTITSAEGDFLAWTILLLCDGLNIQQNLNNNGFVLDKYIDQLIEVAEKLEYYEKIKN